MAEIDFETLEPLTDTVGFKVKETEEYVIEVWKMLFNWRLMVLEPNQKDSAAHGYCYFGTGADALLRAIAAGQQWEDPYNSDPIGYDKKAF